VRPIHSLDLKYFVNKILDSSIFQLKNSFLTDSSLLSPYSPLTQVILIDLMRLRIKHYQNSWQKTNFKIFAFWHQRLLDIFQMLNMCLLDRIALHVHGELKEKMGSINQLWQKFIFLHENEANNNLMFLEDLIYIEKFLQNWFILTFSK
jgi:hypothetical protein